MNESGPPGLPLLLPAIVSPELHARWAQRGPSLYVPALLVDSRSTAEAALQACGIAADEATTLAGRFNAAGARLTLADRLPAAGAEIADLRSPATKGCWLCVRRQAAGGAFEIFVAAPKLAGFDAEIAQDLASEMRRRAGHAYWTILIEPVAAEGELA